MIIDGFDTSKEVFIIAELSANHAGSLELAKKTIKAAKLAGANAIKLQTYTPDSLTLNCKKDDFLIKDGLWKGKNLYELYERAKTPYSWHKELFECAKNEGIICFSTPFCKQDLEFLKEFNLPAYKIASFEANDENFIRLVAKEQKAVIVSTGIASEDELFRICEIFKEEKNENLMFLKCTSAYPSKIEDLNLNAIKTLREKFKVEVGLSDHTLDNLSSIVAVSLGARVIEKHFILDKNLDSEDAKFSLDFDEFKNLVKDIRNTEKSLGDGRLVLNDKILKNRTFARSLYASKDIKKGEKFSKDNVKSVRPSFGLHPKFYNEILGKIATKDIQFGDALKIGDFK